MTSLKTWLNIYPKTLEFSKIRHKSAAGFRAFCAPGFCAFFLGKQRKSPWEKTGNSGRAFDPSFPHREIMPFSLVKKPLSLIKKAQNPGDRSSLSHTVIQ
jgi:hypothetical protein